MFVFLFPSRKLTNSGYLNPPFALPHKENTLPRPENTILASPRKTPSLPRPASACNLEMRKSLGHFQGNPNTGPSEQIQMPCVKIL